jgi:hypothetical protein
MPASHGCAQRRPSFLFLQEQIKDIIITILNIFSGSQLLPAGLIG